MKIDVSILLVFKICKRHIHSYTSASLFQFHSRFSVCFHIYIFLCFSVFLFFCRCRVAISLKSNTLNKSLRKRDSVYIQNIYNIYIFEKGSFTFIFTCYIMFVVGVYTLHCTFHIYIFMFNWSKYNFEWRNVFVAVLKL